jgi:hypothetical protein
MYPLKKTLAAEHANLSPGYRIGFVSPAHPINCAGMEAAAANNTSEGANFLAAAFGGFGDERDAQLLAAALGG